MDSKPTPDSDRSLAEVVAALSRGRDRYESPEELARGGMGAIHRVWDRDLRRPLAMKVFLGDVEAAEEPGPDSTVHPMAARFVEEAQITGQLDHPGIVPVHELGLDEEGRLFFTMRLVQGHTLGEVFAMARDGAGEWSDTKVLRTLVRVCEAVAYAHSRGVVHRDLKPANIMVGPFGEVYVMDWGLAKVVGEDEWAFGKGGSPAVRSDRMEQASGTPESHLLTMAGNVLGTPAYMPPEQARGRIEEVGPHSDVYALGAILYEFLTGRAPYAGAGEKASAHEVVRAVLEGAPPPVLELDPEAPPELVAVCEKAMARDAGDRYADALEMAEALSSFFERPVTRARHGLQQSKLATGIRWVLGFMFWALSIAAVVVSVLAVFVGEDANFGMSVPITVERLAEESAFTSDVPWIKAVTLGELEGQLTLQSTHWGGKLAMALFTLGVIGFLLFVVQQARQILATLRSGDPFAQANLRRMRRIGLAFVFMGVFRTFFSPLAVLFIEELVQSDSLALVGIVDVAFTEFLVAALIFVLAEVFRVGAELERRDGTSS